MDNIKVIIVLHDTASTGEHNQTVVLEGVLKVKAGCLDRTKDILQGAQIFEETSPHNIEFAGEIVDAQYVSQFA